MNYIELKHEVYNFERHETGTNKTKGSKCYLCLNMVNG